jgi:hypothetical protein
LVLPRRKKAGEKKREKKEKLSEKNCRKKIVGKKCAEKCAEKCEEKCEEILWKKKKKFEGNFGEKKKKFLKKKNIGKAVLATFEIDQIYCTVASYTTSYQCEEPNDESPSLLLNM